MRSVLTFGFIFIFFTAFGQVTDLIPNISLTGKSYFTEAEKKKYELLQVPLEQVQYYIDGVIWAEREIPEAEIKNAVDFEKLRETGRLSIKDGRSYEVLKFPRKTACILETAEEGIIVMRFGRGEDELLVFKRTDPVNYDKNQYYQVEVDKDGNLTYMKKKFKVLEGKTTKIEFKDTYKSKTKTKKTKVKGLKVDN